MAEQHAPNHLAEAEGPAAPHHVPLVIIAKAMLFPLFFVVMFALCYISAFHAPTPHDMKLTLVGPAQQTALVADQLAQESPGSFDISTTTELSTALEDLGTQQIAGAIELGPTITAHIASGGGITQAQTVEQVARPIAEATGTTMAVEDASPLGATDNTGMGLFYFMIVCTIGGYLTVMVLSQVAANMPLRRTLKIVAGMSMFLAVVAFAVSSIFVGGYGATAAGLTVLLLVGIVYTFAVGLVALLMNKLAGQSAIFLIMTIAIFLNFPSAGGAIPASFLGSFWQAINSFWIGSGAMQSMRSVIYFGGSGLGSGLAILGGWLAVTALLLWVVEARLRRRPAVAGAGHAPALAATM